MNGTVQFILECSRTYIPDAKVRNESIRGLEIGRTTNATIGRQTFYLKHQPTAFPSLYVAPYFYSATSSLLGKPTNSKYFKYDSDSLACTFAAETEAAHTPNIYTPVLASYEYNKKKAYKYSDKELVGFLKQAISYVNNTYQLAYAYTGTINTLTTNSNSSSDNEVLSTALAIVARINFLEEAKLNGMGINFKGPMSSIDSVQQMKSYQTVTEELIKRLDTKISNDSFAESGQIIDIYSEPELTA